MLCGIQGSVAKLIAIFFFLAVVLLLSILDIKYRRAPDFFTLGGLLVMLAIGAIQGVSFLLPGLFGATLGFSILFLSRLLTQKGLGLGDVKFGAFLGAGLGPRLALLAFLAAGILALTYAAICYKKKGLDREARIPFVPFLGAGVFIAVLVSVLLPGYWN